MEQDNNLIRVFSGMETSVNLLKSELEKRDIACLVKNDFKAGISAGFSALTESAVDLFIREQDLKKAEPIIKAFTQEKDV